MDVTVIKEIADEETQYEWAVNKDTVGHKDLLANHWRLSIKAVDPFESNKWRFELTDVSSPHPGPDFALGKIDEANFAEEFRAFMKTAVDEQLQ